MLPIRDINPTTRTAFVTLAIIAVNLWVFFAVQPAAFLGVGSDSRSVETAQAEFLYEHALVPCEITHLEPLSEQLVAECSGDDGADAASDTSYFPHKLVAASLFVSLFLHANIAHLLGNMWFLWIFGNNVEERLGVLRYALFYVAGGLFASMAHVAVTPDSVAPAIGASGAIAAVMGAYLVQTPRARVVTIIPPFFFLPFRMPAWTLLIGWFILQFATDPDSGVAWVAHVAGFVFGAALGRRAPARPQPVW